jgi:hypothetical protein
VKRGLNVWKYRDSWVIATKAIAPSGLSISIEPVYVIPLNAHEDLKSTLLQVLESEPKLIPEPDYRDPEFKRTVMAKAVGAKTFRAFYKDAHCFYLQRVDRSLTLEEWPPGPGASFVGPPAWKREGRIEHIEEVLSTLHEQSEGDYRNQGLKPKGKTGMHPASSPRKRR